jgi:hypothetical protein
MRGEGNGKARTYPVRGQATCDGCRGNLHKRELANKKSSSLRRTWAGLSGAELASKGGNIREDFTRCISSWTQGEISIREGKSRSLYTCRAGCTLKWPSENIESESK